MWWTIAAPLLIVFGCVFGTAWAQQADTAPSSETQPTTTRPADETTEPDAAEVTVESIQTRLTQIAASPSLTETVKTEITGLYQQALDQVTLAATWKDKVNEFIRSAESAPQRLKAAREELQGVTAKQADAGPPEVASDATLPDLSETLARIEGEAEAARQDVLELEDEARNRSERRRVLPELLADANKRLETVVGELSEPTPAGLTPQQALARRTLLQARKRAISAEARAYEAELRSYEARSDVLATRREIARLESELAQKRAEAWREIVSSRRQAEAQAQQRSAEEELRTAPRPVRDLAEQNAELARARGDLATEIDEVSKEVAAVEARAADLTKAFDQLREQAQQEGTSGYLGLQMRAARSTLGDVQQIERNAELTERRRATVQNKIFETEEDRLDLVNLDARVAEFMRSLDGDLGGRTRGRIESRVRELLSSRRALLDSLKKDYESYATDLIQLGIAQQNLIEKTRQFEEFIDRSVLWIRSTGPIHTIRVPQTWQQIATDLGRFGRAWIDDVRSHVPGYVITAIFVLGLFIARLRVRPALRRVYEKTTHVFTDSYVWTPVAILYTLVIALPWPVGLLLLGVRARHVMDVTDVSGYELGRAISAGFIAAGAVLLLLRFVRHATDSQGLALGHFRWSAPGVKCLRRHLAWLTLIIVPVMFVYAATERYPEDAWRSSLGRLAFVIRMLAISVFVFFVLRLRGGLPAAWLQKHQQGWLYRTHSLWYWAAVVLPIGLVIATSVGYHYTATQLFERLAQTVRFGLGLLLLHALLVRELLVAQRKLAIEQARKKRAAALEARAADPAQATDPPPPLEESELTIGAIGAQARQILGAAVALGLVVAFWVSWADLLPALGFMDDVRLGSYTVETVAEDGGDAADTVTEIRYITLRHVAIAVFIAVVTYVLARNIPGLLEITILQRLPMDAGGRFAVTSIARYIIVVSGVLMASAAVGIGWSKVQWLVAAISVGLGFGLQEIFANFVSGLMLLFERPIRIGDTVTVGEVSGTVTRIRIRATTITDWDRKELIIPNKEFITGQVINWTLSDSVLRITIPVGVAYGSNTELVQRLLREAALEEPNVLNEPKPLILFMGFGASSLDFEARVYLPGVDFLLQTRHRMHLAIDRKFREHGVEISFPQRDIHIRTSEPPIMLKRAPRASLPGGEPGEAPAGT